LLTHDYRRRGTTSLFAAVDVATGKVIGAMHRRYHATEFRSFLDRIDREVPADLDVHLVLENYATHKTPLIHCWLFQHQRFHLHFTPTYSSWTDQAERWFATLTGARERWRTRSGSTSPSTTWIHSPSCGSRATTKSSSAWLAFASTLRKQDTRR
jgi:hypothetical protein